MTNDDGGSTRGGESERPRSNEWTQLAQKHYDHESERELTIDIVAAIAEARGVSPSEVRSPPLYECVDVAALKDAFFGPAGDEPRPSDGSAEFRYREFRVKVGSDGWIQVFGKTDPEEA